MNQFEVDVNALQTLLKVLLIADEGINSLRGPLMGISNVFESSYISPNKSNFEQSLSSVNTYFTAAQVRIEELTASLNTLLAIVQQAEQVAF
jgi:hypothetical protein